ncbi:hypothetical protein F5Y18DRAFT_429206 [Xylariaceae sp. FL1019]|nr:hypothetical protein F5Y18DRAFT_429206 [Xylariaceae sp. FL1019]
MASSEPQVFEKHGKYEIPAEFWAHMRDEFSSTLKDSDIQIGLDLTASTEADWTKDGEIFTRSSPGDARFVNTRIAEIHTAAKAIGAQALVHNKKIEMWFITTSATADGKTGEKWKRHNTGLEDRNDINKLLKSCKEPAGGTRLIETLEEALETYVAAIVKKPKGKALSLIWFLDGVDSDVEDQVLKGERVDLGPLKKVVMDAAATLKKQTKCPDVRDKLGVHFCLVTSNQKVIKAYNGFDKAAMYEDPETGESFECDIFDFTTIKQVMDMGGWNSPLTHMKLIGGARSRFLNDVFEYIEQLPVEFDSNGKGQPPSNDDLMAEVEKKRGAKA